MNRVSHWPALSQLSLGSNVTGQGLQKIVACRELSQLTLTGCLRLRPDDLRVLAELPNLQGLDLDTRQLTSDFMAVLAGVPQLRSLSWDGPKLDYDLALLVSLQQLSRLSLAYADQGVDDADLHFVAQLKNLKQVDLTGTAVTADGVARLRSALPECEIIWDGK
jgi:hypothetical protein